MENEIEKPRVYFQNKKHMELNSTPVGNAYNDTAFVEKLHFDRVINLLRFYDCFCNEPFGCFRCESLEELGEEPHD